MSRKKKHNRANNGERTVEFIANTANNGVFHPNTITYRQ